MKIKETIRLLYRAYRYRLSLDSNEIKFMVSALKKGDIAVDIGAHKGAYSYWISKAVGNEGICYSFEPQPSLFKYLVGLKKMQLLRNVEIANLAVSTDAEDQQVLYVPGQIGKSSPGASLENIHTENVSRIEVRTTSLDAFFENRNIFPKLIKIDVEGHESDVIKGGKKLLARHKPILLIECEQRHINQPIYEVFNSIVELGYKGSFFYNNDRISLDKFEPSIHQKQGSGRYWVNPNYVNNFIFESS